MENREYTKILFPLILFILIGSALNGSMNPVEPDPPVQKTNMHQECYEYDSDYDNDNLLGFIQDAQCMDYPYSDGNGQTQTLVAGQSPHANYFDMTVDLVREFVGKECSFNLNNCVGTNFENEVQFYCWFSDNIMDQTLEYVFDKFANQNPIGWDDGSLNTFVNTCNVFPPSNMPSTMPDNGDQINPSIPDNPTGSPNGGGGMK